MPVEPTALLFAAIVFVAFTVQNAVGFGALLVCVTVGTHVMDIRDIVTMSIPLALLQAGWVVWRDRTAVAGSLLLKRILPLTTVGLLLGFVLTRRIESGDLQSAFAVLIIGLAGRELWMLWRERGGSEEARPPPRVLSMASIFGAGVVHGLYGTGGPLLVYAVGREGLDKRRFRGTLSALWVGLNSLLVGGFALEGRYTPDLLRTMVVLLIALPFGLIVGELIHRRVAERPFKASVYGLLIVAAASLLWRGA